MIETNLKVEERCHQCSAFEPSYSHTELYTVDGEHTHLIAISCANKQTCDYLMDYLSKHESKIEAEVKITSEAEAVSNSGQDETYYKRMALFEFCENIEAVLNVYFNSIRNVTSDQCL